MHTVPYTSGKRENGAYEVRWHLLCVSVLSIDPSHCEQPHLESFEEFVHLLLCEVIAQVVQVAGQGVATTVLAQHNA